ncbi:MAG: ComF family protein [Prolixibacteraceae bacterium]|nr:ComF family protein [Prolixibacteraceae bacterium]
MLQFTHKLKTSITDFLSLIYPNLCFCCGNALVNQEKAICLKCLVGMPRTHYHLVPDNPVEQLFWGRVQIEKATAWFLFQKGSPYRNLLHQLKYKGQRQIGVELGANFGADLMQVNYFANVDVIAPVPLHPRKKRKRGYNQSLAIAEGLASIIDKPINTDTLYRKSYSETQTRKGRFERWENVTEIFDIRNNQTFEEKHVLLIDDVITTGSTIDACAQKILQCRGAKVSVAALAWAAV